MVINLAVRRSRYSNRAVRKLNREVNCTTNNNINNHLTPASVCVELENGNQEIY